MGLKLFGTKIDLLICIWRNTTGSFDGALICWRRSVNMHLPSDFGSLHVQVEQIMLWIRNHSLAAITFTTVITAKNNSKGYL